ncbi:class I SAM-dependent methyltransferase [Pseudodesulfovibrio sp.]|uniref:class I SAM-dependent methyltransferase n=1 Tax=unclassified Pseudodesulfovibrio TaxID=2661612 RepID=UPI003B006EAD
MFDVLGKCIPEDHCRQVEATYFLPRSLSGGRAKLLDHGCGAGGMKGWIEKNGYTVDYYGVDIESSPEVAKRPQELNELSCMFSFDGIELPFEDNFFDIVYSNTVFEHVRYPEKALDEIYRVLAPGGELMVNFAYLYPYHSYSIYNITPYGWFTILEDHGFELLEMRPGIDGIASIIRGYNFGHERFTKWFSSSPFHRVIERQGRQRNLTVKQINMRKIMNAGVICSYAVKNL